MITPTKTRKAKSPYKIKTPTKTKKVKEDK